MVSNNSGGEKTLRYGQTSRYVRQVKIVLRDGNEYVFGPVDQETLEKKCTLNTLEGEVYRDVRALIAEHRDVIMRAKPDVSKNASGYALWEVEDPSAQTFNVGRLIVGSQGTFGIITEVTLGLVPVQPHSCLLVMFLTSLDRLGELTTHILKYEPESLESYDDHTFTLALKVLPGILKQLKGNIITLAFRFVPEAWAVLTGGVPKLILLAEFTDTTEVGARTQAERARASLASFGIKSRITRSRGEIEKYWTVRRESFNLLRKHTKGMRTAPVIDDIVVDPKHLPEFLPRLYAILDEYPDITYTIAGHVGNGNFHIIPLMDLRPDGTVERLYDLMDRVYDLVFSYNGSMTGEHNDGIVRTPFLERMFGKAMLGLFAKTKAIFDPDQLFNPHKKVDVTRTYAQSHMVRHN